MKPAIYKALLTSAFIIGAVALFAQTYNQAYLDSLAVQNSAKPQSEQPAQKFLLTGYMSAGVMFSKEETSFNNTSFNPIFLWKPSDRILIEGELELELEGNETNLNLEYIDVSYFLNKYITLRAGKFLSPFGIFQERLHPAWINKLPTAPLGIGHDGVGPSAEIGFDVRGGIPLGPSKLNYSLYVSNGPTLNMGDSEPEEAGMLMYENADDNNKNKAFGGRIGFLPLSNSSLEVGGSYQTAKVGSNGSIDDDIGTQQYALDLIYVKQLAFLKGLLDIKAQKNWVNVDQANFKDPTDPTGVKTYTFDNKRTSVFAQAAYRPNMATNKILKKTELVFRYAELNPPGGSMEPDQQKQYMYGLDYWLNWRTAFKAAYQRQNSENTYYLQVALGF